MTIWFSSDFHFSHYNLVRVFTLEDGSPARVHPVRGDRFVSIEEHDEYIIERHNALVRPSDHFYHLGDVAMDRRAVDRLMPRLNGHRRLVRGNHDIFKTALYAKHFEEIYSTRQLDGLLFSHIPIAPWSFNRAVKANCHGHAHANTPLIYRWLGVGEQSTKEPQQFDRVYMNISLENTRYEPMSLEQLKAVLDLDQTA
jgi:calcineurin-like phosphoesterase family protein